MTFKRHLIYFVGTLVFFPCLFVWLFHTFKAMSEGDGHDDGLTQTDRERLEEADRQRRRGVL